MAFTDVAPENKPHTYAVTVNYTQGESGYSNTVTLSPSSVNGIAASAVGVTGTKGGIIVTGASGLMVRIAASDGKLIVQDKVDSDRISYAVTSGVYVVSAGDKTFKVVVR